MRIVMPSDPTPEEIKIVTFSKVLVYEKLEDPLDKLIVALVYELDYGKENAALAAGVHYKTVWSRIKKIKRILESHYPDMKLPD